MKTRLIYILTLALLAAACTKDETVRPTPEMPPSGSQPIVWQASTNESKTRAMIGSTAFSDTGHYYYYDASGALVENPEDAQGYPTYTPVSAMQDCVSLEQACDTRGELKHGIGFWVDYIQRDGLTENVFRDVFNAETKLVYDTSGENPHNHWNYMGAAEYWALGGRYLFRAFYPNLLQNYIIDESSNGELVVLQYNTHKYQHDLMVAYNEVFTVDPRKGGEPSIYYTNNGYSYLTMVTNHVDGKNVGDFHFSQRFDLSDPVPLPFHHTQAAVRVRFTFNYEDYDELTSVFFRNTEKNKGLHTDGLLLFGAFEPFEEHEDADAESHKNTYYPYDTCFHNFERLNTDKRTFKWSSQPHDVNAGDFYVWRAAVTDVTGRPLPSDYSETKYPNMITYRSGIPFWYEVKDDGSVTEVMAIAYSDSRDQAGRMFDESGALVEGSYREKMHAEDNEANLKQSVWVGIGGEVQCSDKNGDPITLTDDNSDGYVDVTLDPKIVLEPSTTVMNDPNDPIDPDTGKVVAPPTFASNEGWVFILPQAYDGTTELCFTTSETGDKGITARKLPAHTGTYFDTATRTTVHYDDWVADKDGIKTTYSNLTEASFCHFAPGSRYTYTITVGKTNVYLNLMVEPWQEKWATTEIEF